MNKEKDYVFINNLDINYDGENYGNIFKTVFKEHKNKCVIETYSRDHRLLDEDVKKQISEDRIVNIKTLVKENKLNMKKRLVFFIEE